MIAVNQLNSLNQLSTKCNVESSDDTLSVSDLYYNDGILIACYNRQHIIKSSDCGFTWISDDLILEDEDYISKIYKNNKIQIAYYYENQFYISSDDFKYSKKEHFFTNSKLIVIEVCTQDSNIIVSTNKGVYIKNINDENWRSINKFYKICCGLIKLYENRLYISTENGLYRGNILSDEWEKFSWLPTKNNEFIYSLINLNSKTFITTDLGIFFTTDLGNNWKNITSNIELPIGSFGGILKIFEFKNKLYCVSINGIFLYDEIDTNWKKCKIENISDKYKAIWSFAISNNYIFIGNQSGGIYRSNDGENFSKLKINVR